MQKLEVKLREQIDKLKSEILSITNQIETFRNEGDEGDVGINIELQDKLEMLIEKVQVLQKNLFTYQEASKSSRVAVGKTLQISNSNISNKEIVLVLPEDANSQDGFVSLKSPLGAALINNGEGDTVSFETPGGVQEFVISKVF